MKIPYEVLCIMCDILHTETLVERQDVELDFYNEANAWEITISIPKTTTDE